MDILKVTGAKSESAKLELGQYQDSFQNICENSLPSSFLQSLSSVPASIVLTGYCGKLSSLKEMFAQYVQLESTVFISACEVKRDEIADLFHISPVKNYVQSMPLERQLKKVKLSEAIVRLISKRHSNSSYGVSSCLIVNLYNQGMITSIVDVNLRSFHETFARGSVFPMVEKLIFGPSKNHFILHVNRDASAGTLSSSVDGFNEIKNLFIRKHSLISSSSNDVATKPRAARTTVPGYARSTISSRKPTQVSRTGVMGKAVGSSPRVGVSSRRQHSKPKEAFMSTKTRNTLISTILDLKGQVTQIKRSAVQPICSDLALTRQNLDQLMSKFISQGHTISELETSVSDQNTKLEELQSRYEQKVQEVGQLQLTESLLVESKNSLASLQEKHNKTLERLHLLENDADNHNSVKAQLEGLQQANSIQEKNLSKLTSILEEKETALVEMRGLQKINESLEAQKAKLEQEANDAKSQYDELKEIEGKYQQLKEVEGSQASDLQELERYKKSNSEYVQEIETYKQSAQQQQTLIEKQEAKIAELNETINKIASFEYPELDFTKINYPLTNSPTMEFNQEFGDENVGTFKKPTQLRSSSPLRMSNDTNIVSRFDAVASKRRGIESNSRTSLPKPFSDDQTLH